MISFDLRAHVLAHNRGARLRAAGYAIAALPLWWLSYWIVAVLAGTTLTMFGAFSAWRIVTWAVLALLAFEGVRYGKQLFDLSSYARSFYHLGFTGSEQEADLRVALSLQYGIPNVFGIGYVISQILFAAPRSVVNAWNAWRSIVPGDEASIERVRSLFERLLAARGWVELDFYTDRAEELDYLRTVGLLWGRVKDGTASIRIAAHVTASVYQEEPSR